eukprot:TRINITY_DN50640_c0_g1_i1.p1 TRINITY_DN50640_c0_g1~~TRINITY_DN50640_c0_g1_i1.p1  ORF type:complete len:367 (-),score=91.63 TRINITY_DN50640_c0_g1_i1:49-1122(-)
MITTVPLRVRTAATVICVRQAPQGRVGPAPVSREEATGGEDAWEGAGGDAPSRLAMLFGKSQRASFHSRWEVLMGQREVQNWLKSSPGSDVPMRYPGEWNFAGGAIDPGEAPEDAARRELQEEFRIPQPLTKHSCKLRLLSIKQTRPISNVSNIMYNYVAAAEENPWLEQLDVEAVNKLLAERREQHRKLLEAGAFFDLTKADREEVTPEIHQVQWLDMRSAVLDAFSSMNRTVVPVNAFQQQEFMRLGIARRDPMFLTMATLLEVDTFPSVRSLISHSRQLCPDEELRHIQWLKDGMSPEEVATLWNDHSSPTDSKQRRGMFSTAEERGALWQRRLQEDSAAAATEAGSAERRSML